MRILVVPTGICSRWLTRLKQHQLFSPVLLNGTRSVTVDIPMSSVRMGKAFEAVNRCIDSLVDQKDLDQVGGVFSFQIHKFLDILEIV